MESSIPVLSLGAAAFWIALAAVLIAGKWFGAKREAQRQQTLLQIIEKTGHLDEEQVKAIFPPPPPLPPHWFAPPQRPEGRRAMRIFGTLALSIALGIATFCTIMLEYGTAMSRDEAITGFASASVIACFGVGLLIAARFVRPPLIARGDREAS